MSTARKGKNMSYAQRRQAQARQTERNILQAALTLMRERGFDKVSIRDICKQAGITTGAFYHHFPSKESLLNKGFAPLDDYMEAALRGHEADEPAERLGHILSAYARFMEEEGGELSDGQSVAERLAYELVWQIVERDSQNADGDYLDGLSKEQLTGAFSPESDFYLDADGNVVFFIQAGEIAGEIAGVLRFPFNPAELLSAVKEP